MTIASTYTTTRGQEYVVCEGGRYAYPALGPAFFPADLWGLDCALARGECVDRDLPADSYAVRGAGAEWAEVWMYLNDR